jgi:hypothetical protein
MNKKFSFSKKSKIYFRPYYGYGDWISVNGMVRFLSSKYNKVILVIDSGDIDFVRNLYKDDSAVEVLYYSDIQESEFSSNDYLNLQIWDQVQENKKNFFNRFNRIGDLFNFNVSNVDDVCYERLEFPHNFRVGCEDILENNASAFYVAAGIPKEYRLDNFYYKRDCGSEDEFFAKLNLPKDYVVICDYGTNLINKNYIQNKDFYLLNINNISEKYFDIIKVIENAKEVHLIENSIALLIYHLQYKNLMKNVQINIHTYARKENVRTCTSRQNSNIYLDMFIFPKLDNWDFIYEQ